MEERYIVLKFRQITLGSYLKLGLICSVAFWIPFALLLFIVNKFGSGVLTSDDKPVTGMAAFTTAGFLSVFFSMFGGVAFGIGASVVWFLNRWFSFCRLRQEVRESLHSDAPPTIPSENIEPR